MRYPARPRSSSPKRQTSSSNKSVSPLHRRASAPAVLASDQSVDNGLAICLFGVGANSRMYDAEFEEDRRRRVVMAEVLPDAEMWRKWEMNEAPLRQGRGWYPALDRHFLELLVISEIATLSHPLSSGSGTPGTAERIHRHAIRVRRVACDRIGQERLGAYCDRVKEAFDAYVSAPARAPAWGLGGSPTPEREVEGEDEIDEDEESEERGRRLSREGSRDRSPEPRSDSPVRLGDLEMEEEGDGGEEKDPFTDSLMEIDLALPFVLSASIDPISLPGDDVVAEEGVVPALSPTRSDQDDNDSITPSLWAVGDGGLAVKIDVLDDVDEIEESRDVEMALGSGMSKKNGLEHGEVGNPLAVDV